MAQRSTALIVFRRVELGIDKHDADGAACHYIAVLAPSGRLCGVGWSCGRGGKVARRSLDRTGLQHSERFLDVGRVRDDEAVAEDDRALGVARDGVVVRDEDHCQALLFVQLLE